MKPTIDHVDSEAALLSVENRLGQIVLAHLPMQPLAPTASDLLSRVKLLRKFNHGAVEIWHPRFETVGHREFVAEHQQFVGKRGPNLEQLKAPEFVQVLHLRLER